MHANSFNKGANGQAANGQQGQAQGAQIQAAQHQALDASVPPFGDLGQDVSLPHSTFGDYTLTKTARRQFQSGLCC
jgi:hypothetical protein